MVWNQPYRHFSSLRVSLMCNVILKASLSSKNYLPTEVFLKDQRTDVEKAEHFNRYFQSVVSSENRKEAKLEVEGEINSLHFTHTKIFEIMKYLDVNKAKGPDWFGDLLLNRYARSLPDCLHLLFNTISNKRNFPTAWKQSEVILLHKDGNKQQVSNYRPIILLSALSRFLEKLVFDNIYPVLCTRFSIGQHGFCRKQKIKNTKLREYLHQLFISIDSAVTQNPVALYVEFQRSFNKVNHSLLFEKLVVIGIRGNCQNSKLCFKRT